MRNERHVSNRPLEPALRAVPAAARGEAAMVIVALRPRIGAGPAMSRRTALRVAFWAGLGVLFVSGIASVINTLWSRSASRLTGSYVVGNLADLLPGSKIPVTIQTPRRGDPLNPLQAEVYLARLDERQAARNPGAQEGMVYAFWRKCPHLGCTVPWVDAFSFQDPRSGATYPGWFRCPCHGSTYSDAGVRVFGPAPRSLDMFPVTIERDGTIVVDVSQVMRGSAQNAEHGVLPSAETEGAPA